MELTLLQTAASFGGGIFLAVIIFIMYRSDRKSSEGKLREDRKFMEDRLTKILEEDLKSREENTKVLSELRILIERLNGRH